MASKNSPAKYDCYNNALPDEPMFILLARDPDAPLRVREWASERQRQIDKGERPLSDVAMVEEARQCADDMELWRTENYGAWRNPPWKLNVDDSANFVASITDPLEPNEVLKKAFDKFNGEPK